jgi:hypothetical protein
MVSYIVAVVAGVPAYLMLRAWRIESFVVFLVGGSVLALLPFLLLVSMSSVPGELLAGCIIVGAVNGVVFWLVVVSRSNKRLQIDAATPRD